MKFLAAIGIMMGFAPSTFAQQSDDATIQGVAAVTAQVVVTAGTSLDFKNVTPGVAKTIGFTENVTAGTTTGSETTGHFTITKGANTQVTLEFTTLPTTLAGTGGALGETLPITYTAQLYKLATAVHPIAAPAEGNTVPVINASTTAPYYATSSFQLDLGGTVSPINAQVAGTYQSDITLTATYN